MSLVSTLAKVALGVAIAKGVSHLSKNGLPGATNAGTGRSYAPQQSGAPGGLGDMMGDILGGKSGGQSTGRSANQGAASQGGLGGLLEQLAGQNTANRPASQNRNAPPSSIEDLLGGLTGAGGGGSGGELGDLLGSLTKAAGGGHSAQSRGYRWWHWRSAWRIARRGGGRRRGLGGNWRFGRHAQ